MIPAALRITCTATELAYLTALSGARSVVGLNDPFFGWLAVEVAAALAQIRAQLEERGWIAVPTGGRVVMAPEVTRLVGPLGSAQSCLRLTGTTGEGKPVRCNVYIGADSAVVMTEEPNHCDLYELSTCEAARKAILERMSIGQQHGPAVPAATVPEALIEALRLSEASLPPETVEPLMRTLSALEFRGALLAVSRGDWKPAGLGFLVGTDALWQMDGAGPGLVRISPCTAVEAEAAVERLISQMPAPVR